MAPSVPLSFVMEDVGEDPSVVRSGFVLAPEGATPLSKFNPYHDPANGRFTTGPGGSSGTATADPLNLKGDFNPAGGHPITTKLGDYLDVSKVDMDTVEAVKDAFDIYHDETGMRSQVTGIYGTDDGGNVHVIGEILDENDEQVGDFMRDIFPETREVSHQSLFINEAYQGKGFAKAFLTNAEAHYRAQGIQSVLIEAGMSVGGYAWAKAGFDFIDSNGDPTDPPSLDLLADALSDHNSGRRKMDANTYEHAVSIRLRLAQGEHVTAYEIATLGEGHDDYVSEYSPDRKVHLGAAVLLGTEWSGMKDLTTVAKSRVLADLSDEDWEWIERALSERPVQKGYDPNQPRDERGRWTDTGSARSDYGGGHAPPSNGPPLHDLLDGDSWFPDDVYTHPEFYGHGHDLTPDGGRSVTRDSIEVLRRVRGNPDAPVTVYRAVPPDVDRINTGDWVAISREYAQQHADGRTSEVFDPDVEWELDSGLKGKGSWVEGPPWKVISTTVPAREIRNGGNDIIEWGYWGKSTVVKYSPSQPRDDHGRWTDGTGTGTGVIHGAKPTWSPTMTRDDAEHWAMDSVIQDVLTHTTPRGNLTFGQQVDTSRMKWVGGGPADGGHWEPADAGGTGILGQGLEPGVGGIFGSGIYLGNEPLYIEGGEGRHEWTINDQQAEQYGWDMGREGVPTLRVKVDVRNPLRVKGTMKEVLDEIEARHGNLKDDPDWYVPSKLLPRLGYDALVIDAPDHWTGYNAGVGGDQVVIWDKTKATVIVDDAGNPEDYRFRKYSPSQPRDPKGTSTGGQFASSSGVPSGINASRLDFESHLRGAFPNAHVEMASTLDRGQLDGITAAVERVANRFPQIRGAIALVRFNDEATTSMGEVIVTTVRKPDGSTQTGLGIMINARKTDFNAYDRVVSIVNANDAAMGWGDPPHYPARSNTFDLSSHANFVDSVVTHELGHIVHMLSTSKGINQPVADGTGQNRILWADVVGEMNMDEHRDPDNTALGAYLGRANDDYAQNGIRHATTYPLPTIYSRSNRAELFGEAFTVRHGTSGVGTMSGRTLHPELNAIMQKIEDDLRA